MVDFLRRLLSRNAGFVYTALGSLVSAILGAGFWLTLASILSVESYGWVNYVIAAAIIAAAVGTVGLDTTVTAYLAKGEENLLYEANSLALLFTLAAALALTPLGLDAGVTAAAIAFFTMTIAEALGRRNYRQYALLCIGQRVAQIALSLLFYIQFGLSGIVAGYYLSNLLFSLKYLRSLKNFTLKINLLKEKGSFTVHSYGYNLTRTLTVYLDKILIAPLFGYYMLGIYHLSYQFLMFLSIIPLSLFQYLLPEEASGRERKEVKILGVVSSAVLAAAIIAAAPVIISRFFPTFIEAVAPVQIMSLAAVPATVAALHSASLLAKGKSQPVLKAGLIYITVLVSAIAVLGQAMNAMGLAIAQITAQTIQAAYLTIKIEPPLEH
ncbi:hypothetical protein H5T51_03710 [Candidatus Bathyarchaeota archaeon]|nr:hypothetical protein [Candidatus Bathyarchaeota archaeon]